MKTKSFVVLVALALAGCSNPGVVQLGPDTYLLTRADRAGIFGNASKLKAGVIADANEFAQKQGKVAIPLSDRATPIGGPGQFATYEYEFRVLPADDPEVRRVRIQTRPDIVIEKNERNQTTMETKSKPDLYSELGNLDDLRKRGLLTDAEFEAQKQKVLTK
ncbi:SHOCT domain-containing protein [Oleiharenicola lentus]|uniref:SHOCT domain-containing protein n=1 Tax=Oleiharenicola lentus TaxID=2508720 RepID=UPI003F66A4BB